MAFSNVIKTQFDAGSILVEDGTAVTPLSVTVRFDNADFSASGIAEGLRNHTAYQGRGTLRSLRKTDLAFPTGSFSAQVSDFTEGTTGTLADLILGNGAHSARVSTTSTIGDVQTFDVTLTQEGTDYGDSADGSFVLEDCAITIDFSEGDPNTLSFNWVCYGDITGDLAQAQG